MKLRLIAEKQDKDFFTYPHETNSMWDEKIKEAKDEFDVDFNTENDDSMDQQRIVDIEQNQWEHVGSSEYGPVKFACDMFSAGGDWEFPLFYFRCELKDGHAKDLMTQDHFVFVPNGEQGNGQLTKSDKGNWACPDSDFDDAEEKRDEKKCWESLKEYLKELVDEKIKEVQRG